MNENQAEKLLDRIQVLWVTIIICFVIIIIFQCDTISCIRETNLELLQIELSVQKNND